MTIQQIITCAVAGLLWYAPYRVACAQASNDQKPNIIILLSDDVGYGDLGCYGATHVKTPNLDKFARQGRRFTDAHSASAVCSPSRYALITGRYPVRHKNLWGPLDLKSPLVVDPDRTTIADVAHRAGYATAAIGKWHLGFGDKTPTDWNAALKPGPLELGFDSYFGVPTLNSHPPFVYIENHGVLGWSKDDPLVYGQMAKSRRFDEKFSLNLLGGAERAHALYDDEAVGTTLTEKATKWVRQQAKENGPFFLYFATTNIHHPFTPAKRFQGTSQAGPYGDFIHELDWIVGEVMHTLEETGQAENTLFFFASDNGGMLNRGGQEAWRLGHHMNGQLLGFKFDAWEGGHRVPLIARWPGKIVANTESNSLTCLIDLLATVADVTGQQLWADEGPDSISLLPALVGESGTQVREELLLAPHKPANLALRQGKWIYIGARGGGGFPGENIGDHNFGGPPAIEFAGEVNSDIENGKSVPGAPEAQLYDLSKDPAQTRNVIRDNPTIAAQMKTRLESIRKQPTAR